MSSLDRNFFEMAATVAQQGVAALKKSSLTVESDNFMLRSNFLEQDYQDCLFAFVARGKRMTSCRLTSLTVAKALNKFSQGRMLLDEETLLSIEPKTFARDLALVISKATHLLDWPDQPVIHEGQSYSKEELIALFFWVGRHALLSLNNPKKDPLTPIFFHEEITKMAHGPRRRPFIVAGNFAKNNFDILVDQASLFSANRLKRKSQQNRMGAEPGIRYYHAVLKSSSRDVKLDIIYWLKFDENHNAINGEFLTDNIDEKKLINVCLWSPLFSLSEEQKEKPASSLLLLEVLSMYLESLID